MNNNEKIKQKLATFEVRGVYWMAVDLLRLFDEEMGMITEDVDDEWYLFYVRKLKERYERELIVDKSNVKQIDLEDSIKEIKDGKVD